MGEILEEKELRRPFARKRTDYLINLINPKKNDRILNIGISNIPDIEIRIEDKIKECWTIDFDNKKLNNAGKFLKKTFLVNADISKTDFKKNYFDKVAIIEVLEHLEDDAYTIKWINSILKNSGFIILSVPNKSFFHYFNPVKYLEHKRHYNKESIISLLEDNGFKVEHFNTVETWTLIPNLYLHVLFKFILKKNIIFGIFRKKSNKSYNQLNNKGMDFIILARKL